MQIIAGGCICGLAAMREYYSGGDGSAAALLAFVAEAHSRGRSAWIEVSYAPWLREQAWCRACLDDDGIRYYVFKPWELKRVGNSLMLKVAASIMILMLLPLFFILTVLIWLSDGCPVFFVQKRAGVRGSSFRIYKFRTMLRRADRLHGRLQRSRGGRDHLFKLDSDPRVTPLGHFLRRNFLDELPQLVNVVKGEMALVGPRPLPASDDVHYVRSEHQMRLMGMPGMSGLWQVSGRNSLTFDEMCLLDIYYLANQSWWLDLVILYRTMFMVFGNKGSGSKA